MTKIFLLGSGGFIGKSLLQKLIAEKFDVSVLIHDTFVNHDNSISGDILNFESFNSNIQKTDFVINLIGQYHSDDENFLKLNLLGGLNLLNSCLQNNIKKIILISTINVYGENMITPSKETDSPRPLTNYGIIKLLTEKLYMIFSNIYGLDITILRLANIYGPNKKAGYIAHLINSTIKNLEPIPAFNNGNQLRDVLFIDDAITGIVQAIKNFPSGYNIFNISSSKKYSMNEIINKIENITNKKLNVKFNSEIPDERCIWADNSKSKEFLGFSPHISLDDGLKITLDNLMHYKK